MLKLKLTVAAVLALVFAALVAAEPPLPPGFQAAFSMGRMYFHNDSAYRRTFPVAAFDHSGVAFGLINVGSSGNGTLRLTSVSVELAAVSTDNATVSQPHAFGAFYFEYERASEIPLPLSRPPPLHTAKRHFNFSTAAWASGVATTQLLFNVSDPQKTVVVWLIKLTEADFNRRVHEPNYCTFVAFKLRSSLTTAAAATSADDSVEHLVVLPEQQQQQQQHRILAVASPSERRLEFWGDSLTAGYCNLGTPGVTNGSTSWAQQSFIKTWGSLAAERLGAHYHAVAWSGMGLVRNYMGIGSYVFPLMAAGACGTDPARFPWSYANASRGTADTKPFVPNALILWLGSNDFTNVSAAANSSTAVAFVAEYKRTVERVVNAYSPFLMATTGRPLVVFATCGAVTEVFCPLLHDVRIWARRALARRVDLRVLTMPMLDSNQTSCGHPDIVGDEVLALHVEKEVRNALKW